MRDFVFATFTEEQKLALDSVTPQEMIVEPDMFTFIRDSLNLNTVDPEELVGIRNAVVKHYGDQLDTYYSEDKKKLVKPRDEEYDNHRTRMSMVVSVVDFYKHQAGIPV